MPRRAWSLTSRLLAKLAQLFATFTATNSVGSSSATFSFQVGPSLVPGDWNQDGKFDENDLPAMLAAMANLAAYQASTGLTDAQLLTVGDANGDGQVSNADIQALIDAIIAAASGAGPSTTNAAVATSPPRRSRSFCALQLPSQRP